MLDAATQQGALLVGVAHPVNTAVSSLWGLDLNPDFGNGQEPQILRKAPLMGAGEQFYFHIEVVGPFTALAGNPVVEFLAVISKTGEFGVSTLAQGADFICVGHAGAPIRTIGARDGMTGWLAAELPVGKQLYVPINPWTDTMGIDPTSAAAEGKDYRYMGIIMRFPNYDVSSSQFDGGVIQYRLVKHSGAGSVPKNTIYPPATRIVG